jgi:hypothetical protein
MKFLYVEQTFGPSRESWAVVRQNNCTCENWICIVVKLLKGPRYQSLDCKIAYMIVKISIKTACKEFRAAPEDHVNTCVLLVDYIYQT